MVNLNGHEVGNDGYSQGDTCSHCAIALLDTERKDEGTGRSIAVLMK